MHVDQAGVADAVPFGDDGPYVVVRVQPMAGELARYNVTSSYEEEPEEDIMQTSRIPERIVQTSMSSLCVIMHASLTRRCFSSPVRIIQVQDELGFTSYYSDRVPLARSDLRPRCHLAQPLRRASGV